MLILVSKRKNLVKAFNNNLAYLLSNHLKHVFRVDVRIIFYSSFVDDTMNMLNLLLTQMRYKQFSNNSLFILS